eukprot:11693342-Ditylum_brightwellii.AAC.1
MQCNADLKQYEQPSTTVPRADDEVSDFVYVANIVASIAANIVAYTIIYFLFCLHHREQVEFTPSQLEELESPRKSPFVLVT